MDLIRELVKEKTRAREIGGESKKDKGLHAFGIDEKLYTPKYEIQKHEKMFKNLIKQIDGDIADREREVKEKQIANEFKKSLGVMSP